MLMPCDQSSFPTATGGQRDAFALRLVPWWWAQGGPEKQSSTPDPTPAAGDRAARPTWEGLGEGLHMPALS